MAGFRVASHAIERWQERVARGVGRGRAIEAITAMAAEGRRSEKPPRWLRTGGIRTPPTGGLFVTWHRQPGVALVIKGQTIVTVLTREGGQRFREEQRRRRKWDREPRPLFRRPVS